MSVKLAQLKSVFPQVLGGEKSATEEQRNAVGHLSPAQPLKKAKNGLFTNGETATQRRD